MKATGLQFDRIQTVRHRCHREAKIICKSGIACLPEMAALVVLLPGANAGRLR